MFFVHVIQFLSHIKTREKNTAFTAQYLLRVPLKSSDKSIDGLLLSTIEVTCIIYQR